MKNVLMFFLEQLMAVTEEEIKNTIKERYSFPKEKNIYEINENYWVISKDVDAVTLRLLTLYYWRLPIQDVLTTYSLDQTKNPADEKTFRKKIELIESCDRLCRSLIPAWLKWKYNINLKKVCLSLENGQVVTYRSFEDVTEDIWKKTHK